MGLFGLRWTSAGEGALNFRVSWRKLLVLGSVLAMAAAVAERSMSAGARRRSLDKIRASSPGGALVTVDDSKFDRFITGVPRQYEAVVFFTAAGANFKCASCRVQLDEFTVMAESYKTARADTPEILKGTDIFFFIADFSHNQGSFQQLGLQTVPKIMHFPATLVEGDGGRYAVEPSQFMQMGSKVDAEAIARFVKERTGTAIPIIRPEPPVAIILGVLLVLAALSVKPILSNLGTLLNMIRNKYMWLSVSLMVYTFGVSGGVYDIIRNPAAFQFKPDGNIMWFHPQSNVQFVAEGFITGFMTLFCGLSGILLVQVAPKLRSVRARQIAVVVFGGGFLLLFYEVMKLYRTKNAWYRPVL